MLILAAGCHEPESLCAVGVQLTLVDEQLSIALLTEMQAEGIPVERAASGILCYSTSDDGRVMDLLMVAAGEDSAIRIVGGSFARAVFERLDQANIQYRAQTEEDGWVAVLVANPSDEETVNSIIQSTARQVFSGQ